MSTNIFPYICEIKSIQDEKADNIIFVCDHSDQQHPLIRLGTKGT